MIIALVQMFSEKGDTKSNLLKTKELIRRSVKSGAEIVVFPEMSLTGYFASKKYLDATLQLNSKEVLEIVKLSEELGVTIIFGIGEQSDDKYYITQIVAQEGELIGCYHKHNVINDEANIFELGKELSTFSIGEIKFGITICADIDRPELFREYADRGCNVVFECASPDLYGDRENRDWEKGYLWWRQNCVEKIGKYSKDNEIKIAVATGSGRNLEDDFPGGGYLFSENGEIITETRDCKQEILVLEIEI